VKKALIFGVTGQDGTYLADFLLNKGYQVHGVRRRSSMDNLQRINIYNNVNNHPEFYLHYGDLTDSMNIMKIIKEVRPAEIYNLAAMSDVHVSFESAEYTANTNGIGTLRILEAVRQLDLQYTSRIYQASTSELFGLVQSVPQNEVTPFYPRSPYAVSKLFGYWMSINYREAYEMFVSNGILFNHESPLRGESFVTRKITKAVANIAYGHQHSIMLGNLNATRDWGHAKDYVEAMWLILQHNLPDDFVIATGKAHSVREFVKFAFLEIGVEIEFVGTGEQEKGYVKSCTKSHFQLPIGKEVVVVDPRFYRPSEVEQLLGDPNKAKTILSWSPKYTLKDIVREMMDNDLTETRKIISQF